MVTALHLMPTRFHDELKRNFGNWTNLATISINKCASYFKIDRYRLLNIQNNAGVIFKQVPFTVLQEKQNLTNVRNNLIFQPLKLCAQFLNFKTPGAHREPFLHTRLLNFWLCLHIFQVYIRKAAQVASRKTALTIVFFLVKIVA